MRAAEQPERDHGGRARGRAVRQAGLVAPTTSQQAGLAARSRWLRRARRRGERRRRSPRRSRGCARAPSRRPRATTPQGRFSAARPSASSGRGASPGATPSATLRAVLGARATDSATAARADQRAGRRGRAARRSSEIERMRRRRSSSSCATAASRPTGGCSPPSERAAIADDAIDHAAGSMPAKRHATGAGRVGPVRRRSDTAAACGLRLDEALAREELLDAPVRWPRPSRLQRPLEPAGKAAERRLRALGLRHRRGPARAPAERQPRGAHGRRRCTPGEQATVAGRGARDRRAAGAPPRDAPAGRGDGRRRDRIDAGDVLQPAVAGRSLSAGHAAAAARQVRRARRLPRLPPRARRRRSARRPQRAGAGRRSVAHYPADRGRQLDPDPHARARPSAPRSRDVVEAAAGAMRARPSGCPTAPRARRDALPARARERRARPPRGSPSRSCC